MPSRENRLNALERSLSACQTWRYSDVISIPNSYCEGAGERLPGRGLWFYSDLHDLRLPKTNFKICHGCFHVHSSFSVFSHTAMCVCDTLAV
jgi:hypothetical protein